MLIIRENSKEDDRRVQGKYYTYSDLYRGVTNEITSNDINNKYIGISLAYDYEYGDSNTILKVDSFIRELVDTAISEGILDSIEPDLDYTEVVDEILDQYYELIEDFNSNYDSLVEKQLEDWKEEQEELEISYRRDSL